MTFYNTCPICHRPDVNIDRHEEWHLLNDPVSKMDDIGNGNYRLRGFSHGDQGSPDYDVPDVQRIQWGAEVLVYRGDELIRIEH